MTTHPGFSGPPALVPGELRGFRRFRLAEDGLYPTVHADAGPWSGGLEHATCAVGEQHRAPDRDCGCGLYGWYHPRDASGSSGFGDVTAVIAARGRVVLGDHGFRAESARVLAVALPPRVSVRGRAASRMRRMLAEGYPHATVYRSRRQMMQEHPPPDLRALGVDARPNPATRYRRIAFLVWLVGVVTLPFALVVGALPRGDGGQAGPAVLLGALAAFFSWQALLVWLVMRCTGTAQRRTTGA